MYSYKRHQGLIWQPVLGKLDSNLRAFAVFISCKKSLALLVWGDLCRKFRLTLSWKTLVILSFTRAENQIGEVNLNQISWFHWWHKFKKFKCSCGYQTIFGVFPLPLCDAFTLWQLSCSSSCVLLEEAPVESLQSRSCLGGSELVPQGVSVGHFCCLAGSVQPFPQLLCRHERTNTTLFKGPGRSHCGCHLSPSTELSLHADLTSAWTSYKCLLHPQCPCCRGEADTPNHVFTSFHLVWFM